MSISLADTLQGVQIRHMYAHEGPQRLIIGRQMLGTEARMLSLHAIESERCHERCPDTLYCPYNPLLVQFWWITIYLGSSSSLECLPNFPRC